MKKEDLIVGNWYIYSGDYYIKFRNLNNNTVWCSEYIDSNKNHRYSKGTCGNYQDLKHANFQDIIPFLPKNHSDLQNIERVYELW